MDPDSVSACGTLLNRRVPLDRLFGPNREFCTRALARLSGGHVCDLLFLAQAAIQGGFSAIARLRKGEPADEVLPLDAGAVERGAREHQGSRRALFRSTSELLWRIAKAGTVDDLEAAEQRELTAAMDQYLAFCYHNGDERFDVLPLTLGALKPPGGTARP